MENQLEHKLYDICCQIARKVAREEVQLALKEQSNPAVAQSSSPELTAEAVPVLGKKNNNSLEWLLPFEGVAVFYSALVEKEKIRCPIEDFRAIFLMPDIATPIRWYGKKGELACLLGTFNARKVVSTSESYWSTITAFFYYSNNKKISHTSLSSQFSQNQFSEEFENFIVGIINKLKSEMKKKLSGVNSS